MPKIGKYFIGIEGQSIEVNAYYVSDKYDPYFVISPVNDKYVLKSISLMTCRTIAKGKTVWGVRGDTEEGAKFEFKKYLAEWYKSAVTKIPVILISIPESSGENHFYPAGMNGIRSTRIKQTGCKVGFEYFFGYKTEVEGKIKYFKDGKYSGLDTDSEIYFSRKNYTEIPGTPENLTKCEDIITSMNEVANKLKDAFDTSERAELTLSAGSTKLFLNR